MRPTKPEIRQFHGYDAKDTRDMLPGEVICSISNGVTAWDQERDPTAMKLTGFISLLNDGNRLLVTFHDLDPGIEVTVSEYPLGLTKR